jgi:hypothetical protein
MQQTIDWELLITTGFGIFISIIFGFFLLKIVLGALSLATSYEEKDALKKFQEVLTSSIKGIFIALGALFVLNTLFVFLNINTGNLNFAKRFAQEMCKLENCLRNYETCGSPSVCRD